MHITISIVNERNNTYECCPSLNPTVHHMCNKLIFSICKNDFFAADYRLSYEKHRARCSLPRFVLQICWQRHCAPIALREDNEYFRLQVWQGGSQSEIAKRQLALAW
jgi:hypothetical protein